MKNAVNIVVLKSGVSRDGTMISVVAILTAKYFQSSCTQTEYSFDDLATASAFIRALPPVPTRP